MKEEHEKRKAFKLELRKAGKPKPLAAPVSDKVKENAQMLNGLHQGRMAMNIADAAKFDSLVNVGGGKQTAGTHFYV